MKLMNPNPRAEETLESQKEGRTLQARRTATTDRISSAADSAPRAMRHRPAILAGAVIFITALVAIITQVV